MTRPICSIVVPAHDEERVIGRLLDGLTSEADCRFEIIVVCNGCTDRTAAIAGTYGPDVRVIEIDQASKRAALVVGDEEAGAFPRLFVDADVEIDAAAIRHLVDAVGESAVLAAAPGRIVPRLGVSPWVRWYYDVWERLPQVRDGLFGRGVIALSEVGNARVRALPPSMGDDLVASEAFEPAERRVVGEAVVIVHPPRTVRDLLRRRVRAVTGNAQADEGGFRGSSAVTSPRTLAAMVRGRPSLALRLPVFLTVSLISRVAARRAIRSGDDSTWLRDESSRASG